MKEKRLTGKIAEILNAYKYILNRNIHVDSKKVLFFTFQGLYTCNLKYICDELNKLDSNIQCIWVIWNEADKNKFPKHVDTVVFGSEEYFHALYQSKVWIDNAFNITKLPVAKKQGQYYVETMHGSLGIKRIGPEANKNKKRNKNGFKCGKLSDYIISNSSFETDVYRTTFWKNTPVLEIGHARNDIFFNNINDNFEYKIRKEIRRFYNIEDDSNLVLYAPTFRLDNDTVNVTLDYAKLKDALEKKFGGRWYVLVRLHPRDIRKIPKSNDMGYVLDGNKYTDIQELMLAIDCGITDYSSWIYDYVLTKKPGLIYAPDLDKYANSTGFYYPITTTPFPVSISNDELVSTISSFDYDKYRAAVENFIQEKGCIDDGTAANKAANLILGLLYDKKPDNVIL